jgi:hypothetical protein
VWRFKLENKDYTIELFTSILSGKKKILQNGQTLYFDSKYLQFENKISCINSALLGIKQLSSSPSTSARTPSILCSMETSMSSE